MAGVKGSEECVIDKTVMGWLLDYIYTVVWDNFKVSKSIDVGGTRDLIQWFGCQKSVDQQSDPMVMLKIQLIVILSRLTDGQDNYDTPYGTHQEWTVLEDMLKMFERLAVPQHLRKEYNTTVKLITKQAVLVCCRAADFTRAEEVFNRIWKDNKHLDNNTKERLEKLISSQNKDHSMLQNNSYESFTDKVLDFLSLLDKEFDTPFLVKVARTQEKKFKEKSIAKAAVPSKDRVSLHGLKRMAERLGLKDKALNGLKQETDLQKKLDRDRNRVINRWLDDVSPSKHTEVDRNQSASKCTEEDRNQLSRKYATSPVSSEGGSDRSPWKSPQDFRSHRYRKNYNREDRHKNDEDVQSPKKSRLLGPPSPTRFADVQSPIKSKLLRPPSPTGSIFGGVRVRWNKKETEEFYQAVQEFGVGQWSEIKIALGTERTNVQLKDKWRTVVKNREIEELESKFGAV